LRATHRADGSPTEYSGFSPATLAARPDPADARNEMISRLGQAMPRFLVGANVAGEGMRERLRSTTFAVFGLVTATGLVLVGIAYNQGWPDFVNSPIPGSSTERVGEARIAAGATHASAQRAGAIATHRSARAGNARLVPGRGSGHASSQPQAPVRVSGGLVLGQAPTGHGGAGAPVPAPPASAPAPAPVAPAPQAAQQPPAAVSPSPTPSPATPPAKEKTPVATTPPVAHPTATVPGKGKAKGHEKSHGNSVAPAPAPAPPKAPSAPAEAPSPKAQPAPPAPAPKAPPAPPKEAPAPAAEQPGNGHAYGHYK
jgi:hypothetical protein